MRFLSQLFTFIDITDYVYVTYVFDSLSAIRHETELSLVLACRVTAAFCARAHLHLKIHTRQQCVSASTQNRHFQNDIINDLWGILS